MKVKELIAELQKQDPEKEVFIEQGDEYAYMKAHSVVGKWIWDESSTKEDDTVDAVVIQF